MESLSTLFRDAAEHADPRLLIKSVRNGLVIGTAVALGVGPEAGVVAGGAAVLTDGLLRPFFEAHKVEQESAET